MDCQPAQWMQWLSSSNFSRLQAVQAATGVCYLLGAFCWIANATWSGWPSGRADLDTYLTGVTAVVGALLFHVGAMCQVWDALNSTYNPAAAAAFTRLPSGVKEPWLEQPQLSSPAPPSQSNGRTPDSLLDARACDDEGSRMGAGQLHSSRSADSLAGLSADSEVQLSDLGGSSPRGNSAGHSAQPGSTGQLPAGHTTECLQQWQLGGAQVALGRVAGKQPGADVDASGTQGQQQRQLIQPDQQQQPQDTTCLTQQHKQEQQQQEHLGSSPSGTVLSMDMAWRQCRAEQQPYGGSPGVSRRHSALPCSPVRQPSPSPKGQKPLRGKWPWQVAADQHAWVWWAWRPQDRPFVAGFVQVVGTTIFLAACVCGFPGVLPTNYDAGDYIIWDALFWAPFLVGSTLFITSALLSLRDCQGSWSTPRLFLRAWWMHVANTVGSIGFWLCSFFGFFAHPAEKYQRWGMAFSCLWGSCCFAIAAWLQLLQLSSPEAWQAS